MRKLTTINDIWYWVFSILVIFSIILMWWILDINHKKQYEFSATYSSYRNAFKVDVETYYKLRKDQTISFLFNDNRSYFEIEKTYFLPSDNAYYISIKNSPIFLDESKFNVMLMY